MAAPAAPAEAEPAGGLTQLDWVVIVAATVALVLAVVWLVQGAPLPRRRGGDPQQ